MSLRKESSDSSLLSGTGRGRLFCRGFRQSFGVLPTGLLCLSCRKSPRVWITWHWNLNARPWHGSCWMTVTKPILPKHESGLCSDPATALSWTQGLNSQADICLSHRATLQPGVPFSNVCSAWALAVMPSLKRLRQEEGKPQARLYFEGLDMVLSGGNQVIGTWEATDQPGSFDLVPLSRDRQQHSSQNLTFIS